MATEFDYLKKSGILKANHESGALAVADDIAFDYNVTTNALGTKEFHVTKNIKLKIQDILSTIANMGNSELIGIPSQPAVYYQSVTEYNSDKETSLTQEEFDNLTDEQKIKIPAVLATGLFAEVESLSADNIGYDYVTTVNNQDATIHSDVKTLLDSLRNLLSSVNNLSELTLLASTSASRAEAALQNTTTLYNNAQDNIGTILNTLNELRTIATDLQTSLNVSEGQFVVMSENLYDPNSAEGGKIYLLFQSVT